MQKVKSAAFYAIQKSRQDQVISLWPRHGCTLAYTLASHTQPSVPGFLC
jgi:hypothetical protein